MTTLGAVFRPQFPPERLRAMARIADEAGLAELWLWEDCFDASGIASAAAALAWTERVRVGIGLLPVPLRNVAVTAMEAATLARLFPERLVLGVGHGAQSWMGQVGARAESPMTLLEEYVIALRALLAGQRVTSSGRYVHLDDVALSWPPLAPQSVYVGARRPRSLRLAGQHGDGTLLDAVESPDALREARAMIDKGRQAGNRTEPHRVVVSLRAATGPDAEARLAAESGFGTMAEVAGDAQAIADAVARFGEAGADTVILVPTADEPDPEGFLRFTVDKVQPLI
ncbi:LLM class flavin-dependent oxidoreductase [Nocardia altamirensis]|uniref:LLM class flavin-dependent oxidoreductase n=1 Tax=Nocardia altamirensis TaxID=472158 RepID=UPI00084051B8|nr:LLM class flavin-dependent oxidoreductase [Nocardia altamirensis]